MVSIISPEELWKAETDETELDAEFQGERSVDGNVYREVYFNGKKIGDEVTRIYGVLATPNGEENPPVVLLCHDTDSSVDCGFVDYFLKLGFAVFMCDMYGKADGRKYTYYPDALSFANRCENDNFRFVKSSPDKTMIFEWTTVQRRAIRLLRETPFVDGTKIAAVGIRDGSEVVWQLSYLEPELSCSVALFYAGWGELGASYKNDKKKQGEITNELASYVAALSPQSYAPIIKVPLLYLSASNSETANLDRAFDTMSRVNGEVLSLSYISPNAINSVDCFGAKNLRIWLDEYLKGIKVASPDKPILSLENFSNKLLAKCAVDDRTKVKRVTLYYAEGDYIPSRRCYFKRELSLSGSGDFVGSVDVSSSEEFIYAFVNVEFYSGPTLTSNFVASALSEMGFSKELSRDKLIYNGLMGEDAFVALPDPEDNSVCGTICDENSLAVKAGAGGIEGISCNGFLSTFKLSHPKFVGASDELFVFDVCTSLVMTITIKAYCSLGSDEKNIYSAPIACVGGPLWQNFKLEKSDFKDKNNIPLSDWSEISLLCFESDGEFIVNNILWV